MSSVDTESQISENREDDAEEEIKDVPYQNTFQLMLTDYYGYWVEDGDNNWMFRALSRSTFKSPEYHRQIKKLVADYTVSNRSRFEESIPGFDNYIYDEKFRGLERESWIASIFRIIWCYHWNLW